MANTLSSVWDELHHLLALSDGEPVATLKTAGARKVYKGEPFSAFEDVIITTTPNAIGADYYQLILRVYVTLKVQPVEVQLTSTAVVDAIEAILETSNFERSDWEIGPDEKIEMWIASTVLQRGREWT